MSEDRFPHLPDRIRVGLVTFDRDPEATIPAGSARLGTDAEGREIYGDPRRASSVKYVFLRAGSETYLGYARADPPLGLTLTDVLRAAWPEPLPRPEALALLGVLTAKHVVLIDGARLGGPRHELGSAVAAVALEPTGFVDQAGRVPEWALAEAARPRWADLSAGLLAVPWVRELSDVDFGFVRRIEADDVVVARSAHQPIDVGQALEIGSQDSSHPGITVAVNAVRDRDVVVRLSRSAPHRRVAPGDPVFYVPVRQSGPADAQRPKAPVS